MAGLAWIANGRVKLREGDGPVEDWPSAFAAQLERNLDAIQRKKAWRHDHRAQGLPWATVPGDLADTRPPARVVDLAVHDGGGRFVYALHAGEVSAVLLRDPGAEDHERAELRLHHAHATAIAHVASRPGDGEVALSIRHGAVASLALMAREGGRIREITEGDAQDLAPAWVPGARALVYQTAGVARTAQGLPVGRGPFGLSRLDLEAGTVEVLVADPAHDLFSPRVAEDGTVWCLRRPWEDPTRPVPLRTLLWNVLWAPVRILRALFGWVDLFSQRYGGGELMPDGGTARRRVDQDQVIVDGHLVDVARARKEALEAGDEVPGRVPKDWVLCRVDTGSGALEVVEHGVATFALHGDDVLVSNGAAIWRRAPDGTREQLVTDEAIERVIAWG